MKKRNKKILMGLKIILTSPFSLIMILIGFNIHALHRWILWMRYGGEFVQYERDDSMMILEVYKEVKKKIIENSKEAQDEI